MLKTGHRIVRLGTVEIESENLDSSASRGGYNKKKECLITGHSTVNVNSAAGLKQNNSDAENPQKQKCHLCGCNTIAIMAQYSKEVPAGLPDSLPYCDPCRKNIRDRSVEKQCMFQYPLISNNYHTEPKSSITTSSDKNQHSSANTFPTCSNSRRIHDNES